MTGIPAPDDRSPERYLRLRTPFDQSMLFVHLSHPYPAPERKSRLGVIQARLLIYDF